MINDLGYLEEKDRRRVGGVGWERKQWGNKENTKLWGKQR